MYSIHFWATIAILIETTIYFERHRRRLNVFQIQIFMGSAIASFGYTIMTRYNDLNIMLIGNEIYYIGGLMVSIFMFLTIADLCDMHTPAWVIHSLLLLGSLDLLLVFTVKSNTLYYKSLEVCEYHGYYFLQKERGPFYALTVCILLGTILASVAVILWSMKKKRNISYRTSTMLLIVELLSTIIFFIPRVLHLPLDYTCVSHVVALAVLLIIFRRTDMYDMSANLQNVYSSRSGYGYLCFDMKKRFMGCNDYAKEIMPDLVNQRVDDEIVSTASPILGGVLIWLEEWNPSDQEERHFSDQGIYVECSIRHIVNNGIVRGYLVEFHDDTRDMLMMRALRKTVEVQQQAKESR